MIELFAFLCNKLNETNIQYMLSGSLALNLYTVPRMTRDIDIVIALKEKDIELFISSFQDRFYYNEDTIRNETKANGMFNIIDNNTGYKIDFIIKKDSPFRVKEFDRRQEVKLMGNNTWVVSIEDLILSKLIWIQQLQSDKQMEDIKNLLASEQVDFAYIRQWINNMNLNTFDVVI